MLFRSSFKLTGVIGNVPRDLFAGNMAQAQAAAFGAQVKGAEIDVRNSGVVEMGLAMQAKQSGQTPQAVQQMLVAGAAMGIPAMLGGGAAAKEIASAVAKFAADPKRLRINATAPNGLGAADFMLLSNPAALLEKLSVSASAND